MMQQILNSRKSAFLTILSMEDVSEELLISINRDWFDWLLNYYQSKAKGVSLYSIPFYLDDVKYKNIIDTIVQKEPLTKLFKKDMVYFESLTNFSPISEYIFVPMESQIEYQVYSSSLSEHTVGYLPRKLIKALKVLPKDIIVILASDTALPEPNYDTVTPDTALALPTYKLFAFMTSAEFYNKKCKIDFLNMHIELEKFGKGSGIQTVEAFVVRDFRNTLRNRGLVGSLNSSFFDLKLVKGI